MNLFSRLTLSLSLFADRKNKLRSGIRISHYPFELYIRVIPTKQGSHIYNDMCVCVFMCEIRQERTRDLEKERERDTYYVRKMRSFGFWAAHWVKQRERRDFLVLFYFLWKGKEAASWDVNCEWSRSCSDFSPTKCSEAARPGGLLTFKSQHHHHTGNSNKEERGKRS